MRFLFGLSRWILNLVGILALVAWILSLVKTIVWKPFDWTNPESIQFIVGVGLLGLYFVLGILGIIFRSAKILRSIISVILCIIGIGALGVAAYNAGIWLNTNNAWTEFKNIDNGIFYICVFSISVGLIGSYVLFGPLLLISKKRKNK